VIGLCITVRLDVNNINVRSGPGTNFAVLGEPLDLDHCPVFSALDEDELWLLIAPGQSDPALIEYEGGWIRRDLLGLGPNDPVGLMVVTLTPTPTASSTPTITPSPTATHTFTPTSTLTATSTPAETPAP
jgi:hypothetical protein